jgi:hypothetical protein
MKKALWSVAALAILATTAWAGAKYATSVTIDSSARWAYGDLGAARNSADPYQRIGCGVHTVAGGFYGTCVAVDASNNQAVCTSSSASFARVAESISGDSHVYFSWDANGYCVDLEVSNDSYLKPKLP